MTEKMKKYALWLLVLFIVAQLIPFSRDNPPVTSDIHTPESLKNVLKKACYDCHSNETKWPWYSYIAPISWLVKFDVVRGRDHLNFSKWDEYQDKDKIHLLEEVAEEVEEKEMPLFIYTINHPEAKLTDEEIKQIVNWAKINAGILKKTLGKNNLKSK
ncbi:MAG: heme-binding domain-containing protein [Spirochaetia bacterium]|nr:heme-binding domain-containing protein [Spirochaetia bacterium]